MAGAQISRNIAMTTSREFSGKCIIAIVTAGLKTAMSALSIVSTSPGTAAKEAGDQEEVSL